VTSKKGIDEKKGNRKHTDTFISHRHTILKEIDRYRLIAIKIRRKNKLSRDDRFKKLLEPIKNLHELVLLVRPTPFIDESINLTRDVDFTSLQYHSSYIIPSGILDPYVPSIYLTENNPFYSRNESLLQDDLSDTDKKRHKEKTTMFFGGGTSLNDIHKKWLSTITEKTIQSKDLLDQILVAYTIKKAQNPYIPWMDLEYSGKNTVMADAETDFTNENPSVEKLFTSYKNRTRALAIKCFEKKINVAGRLAKKEDIIKDALCYLRLIIAGFNPQSILEKILNDKDNFLSCPFWVKDFYIEYFTKNTFSKLAQFMNRVKSTSENKKIIVEALLNILFDQNSLITAGAEWDEKEKTTHQFNNYVYHSDKMGPYSNFTAWLLGTPKQPRSGKIYQLLDDEHVSPDK